MKPEPSPFLESREVMGYAESRSDELDRGIRAWLDDDPYAAVVEPHSDTKRDIHKIILAKPLPRSLTLIAFDAANQLRSALDRAGYVVACAAGATGKRAHFPFGDSLSDVQGKNKGRGRSEDIPGPVFDVMVSFQPYRGGNDLLWGLNRFVNTKKHEVLVPHVATAMLGGYSINISGPASLGLGGSWPPKWDSTKNELVLGASEPGGIIDANLQIIPQVLIGNVEGIGGKPAVRTFRDMLGIVERVLVAVEAEARRIRLFV